MGHVKCLVSTHCMRYNACMENSLNSQEEVNSPPLTTQDTALPLHAERSFVVYVIVALGLALFIRFFIAAPYVVSGASMEPTFDNWHYLIVDRVSYSLGEPERGDVIIFDAPQEHGKALIDRKSTRLNSSHSSISYAVFCLKKNKKKY